MACSGNKRRGPGRPANRYRARQPDDSLRAPPPHPPAATGAASRSNDNDANVPAHDKPVELSQTEQTTLHLLEAFERFKEVRPPPKKKAGTSLPMFLGEPDRSGDWALVAEVPTHELYQWFDSQVSQPPGFTMTSSQSPNCLSRGCQLNDYAPKESKRTMVVRIIWIGHPGNAPVDARARPFLVVWEDGCGLLPDEKARAIRDKTPVLRWDYACAGVHDMVGQAEEEEDTEEDYAGVAPSRWDRCTHGVKLRVEITADDLGVAKIWMRGQHPDATPEQYTHLNPSRRVRLLIHERLSVHNCKVSTVKKEVMQAWKNLEAASLWTTEEPHSAAYAAPVHRRPTSAQISRMYKQCRQRERLDRNPLFAVQIMAEQDPSRLYYHTPHDFELDDALSEFTVGLTDDFSLDSLILHGGTGGWALDSSWRNKNENRAAVTFLITVTPNQHAVPGSVLLSANQATKERLKRRANDILAGSPIEARTASEEAQIRAAAAKIAEDQFDVSHFMIDKCLAELHAIREVFGPDACIRLCQFHAIQALTRIECDNGSRGAPVRVPVAVKAKIIHHFRLLQRCRVESEFEAYKARFLRAVHDIVLTGSDGDDDSGSEGSNSDSEPAEPVAKKASKSIMPARAQELWVYLREYFETNWFIPDWIRLPADQTRDGPWNTNNWIERAFRTFDSVFLDNRDNKRLDRLAMIILCDFLPYYRFWRPNDSRSNRELLALFLQAYQIWESDLIKPAGKGAYSVIAPRTGEEAGCALPDVRLNPAHCQCKNFQQTGKRCAHVKAVELYVANGSLTRLRDPECETDTEGRRVIRGKQTKQALGLPRESKMRSDALDARELEAVRRALRRRDDRAAKKAEQEKMREILPKNAPVGGSTPGRPRNVRPLHEHQTPTKKRAGVTTRSPSVPTTPSRKVSSKRFHSVPHVPVFQRRPGPKKQPRLGANSLLPGTPAVRTALLEASRMPTMDLRPTPDHAYLAEELTMAGMSFDRWQDPEYWLRADEAWLFLDCLNGSHLARETGVIFGMTPDEPLAEAMASVGGTMQEVCEMLRDKRLGRLPDLVASRTAGLTRFIFFHHENQHWTLVEHDLTCRPRRIRRWNSLSTGTAANLSHQHVIVTAIDRAQQHSREVEEPCIDPTLQSEEFTLEEVATGLQTDGLSCGFWSLIFGWARLLRIDIQQDGFGDLSPEDLRDVLMAIWTSYVGDQEGLQIEVLREWFGDYETEIDWDDLPTVVCDPNDDVARQSETDTGHPPQFSQRPVSQGATTELNTAAAGNSSGPEMGFHPTQPVPALTPEARLGEYSEMPAPVRKRTTMQERPDIREKLQCFRLCNEKTWWEMGREKFQREAVEILWRGEGMSTFLVDALLAGPMNDLAAGEWDEAFGLSPAISRPRPDRLLIAPQSILSVLMKAPVRNIGDEGLAPGPRRMKAGVWFKENVFALDVLILPIYWKSDSHWLCVVVHMTSKKIVVYDSLPSVTRAKAVYGRVFKMLQFEYRVRHADQQLTAAGWTAELTPASRPTVPTQGQTLWCGVYMIKFIMEVVCGRAPERDDFQFDPAQAQKLMENLVLRLMESLHIPTTHESTAAEDPHPGDAAKHETTAAEAPDPSDEGDRPENAAGAVRATQLPRAKQTATSERAVGSSVHVVGLTESVEVNMHAGRIEDQSGGPTREAFESEHADETSVPSRQQYVAPGTTSCGEHEMTVEPIEPATSEESSMAARRQPIEPAPSQESSKGAQREDERSARRDDIERSEKRSPRAIQDQVEVETSGVVEMRASEASVAIGKETAGHSTSAAIAAFDEVEWTRRPRRTHPGNSPDKSRREGGRAGQAASPVRLTNVSAAVSRGSQSASCVSQGRTSARTKKGQRRPQQGEWMMMVLDEPPLPGCPWRAFPVEIVKCDGKRKRVQVAGDINLLWLDNADDVAPDPTPLDTHALAKLLSKREFTYQECERMGDEYVPASQIVPMQWPADLEHRSLGRVHAANLTPRRQGLRAVLEATLPALDAVLAGHWEAEPLYSRLIKECLREHGYDEEGEELSPPPPNVNPNMLPWDFVASRVVERHGDSKEHRYLLDAGDEALCTEMCGILQRRQPIRGPTERYHLKCGGAAKVFFMYVALEHYTGVALHDVEQAVADNRIRRPVSRYEQVWKAYEKGWQLDLLNMDSPELNVEGWTERATSHMWEDGGEPTATWLRIRFWVWSTNCLVPSPAVPYAVTLAGRPRTPNHADLRQGKDACLQAKQAKRKPASWPKVAGGDWEGGRWGECYRWETCQWMVLGQEEPLGLVEDVENENSSAKVRLVIACGSLKNREAQCALRGNTGRNAIVWGERQLVWTDIVSDLPQDAVRDEDGVVVDDGVAGIHYADGGLTGMPSADETQLTANEVCRDDGLCAVDRRYEPERDVLLYCEPCARWYHRQCLGPVDSLENVRRRRLIRSACHLEFELSAEQEGYRLDDEEEESDGEEDLAVERGGPGKTMERIREDEADMVSDEEADDDMEGKALWQAILATPVQRGWPHFGSSCPLSFELLQLRARHLAGRPRDIPSWVCARYGRDYPSLDGADRVQHEHWFWSIVAMSPRERIVYRCPYGHFV
ncbi:hypothetical protein C8Q76DRAFT_820141 [Earliella scabrosa]|nr:hypothetical protein C8Q76DRAFT_820141 [Earliella scabrosa]